MARHATWRRLSGDTDNPAAVNLGKKLLGYLAEQRRLSGNKTMSTTGELADGTRVLARWIGDIPEILVLGGGGGRGRGRDTFLQGFVTRPRSDGDPDEFGVFSDVFLDNIAGRDNPSWINLFYDLSAVPPDPAVKRGIYRFNRQHQPLFEDGLLLGGNLDWRNTDESLVLTWYGPCNRYFEGITAGGNDTTGHWVFINGDVIVDCDAYAPLVDDSYERHLIGACVSGNRIVWAVRAFLNGDGHDLRFYHARLHTKVGMGWPGAPVSVRGRQWPRFEPVQAADIVEFHVEHFSSDYFWETNGHPFAFNQAGTEGRIVVTWFDFTEMDIQTRVREQRLVFAGREGITDFTATTLEQVSEQVLTYDSGAENTNLEVRANAFVFEGPPGGEHWYDPYYNGAGKKLIAVAGDFTEYTTPDTPTHLCAIDFKANLPVRAYRKRETLAASGTHAASVTGSSAWSTVDDYFESGSATMSYTRTNTGHNTGLVLPFQIDGVDHDIIALDTETTTFSATSSADDTLVASTSYGAGNTNSEETYDSVIVTERLHVHYLDLRYDSIVYTKIRGTVTDDRVAARTASYSGNTGLHDHTATISTDGAHVTRRRAEVHVCFHGKMVAELDDIVISDVTQTGPTSENVSGPAIREARGWRAPSFFSAGHVLSSAISGAYVDTATYDGLVSGLPPMGFPVPTGTSGPTDGTDDHPDLSDVVTGEVETAGFVEGPQNYYDPTGLNESHYLFTATMAPGADTVTRFGSWQVSDGNFCFSMPWPAVDLAVGFKNVVNGDLVGGVRALIELDTLTGEYGATIHHPLWVTCNFVYEHN